MTDCNESSTQSIELLFFPLIYTFPLVLGFLLIFIQLDLLVAATVFKIVMVHASSPFRRGLAREKAPRRSPMMPPTAVGLNKTEPSNS
jgi:hypothetical protein